jgi:hypothetical protein
MLSVRDSPMFRVTIVRSEGSFASKAFPPCGPLGLRNGVADRGGTIASIAVQFVPAALCILLLRDPSVNRELAARSVAEAWSKAVVSWFVRAPFGASRSA